MSSVADLSLPNVGSIQKNQSPPMRNFVYSTENQEDDLKEKFFRTNNYRNQLDTSLEQTNIH